MEELEAARCLTQPDDEYFCGALDYSHRFRSNGVDLSAAVYPDRSCWICTRCLALAPVEGKLWEQATPAAIISHPALRSIPHRVRGVVGPACKQTGTYLFRTEQGTFGILHCWRSIILLNN